MPVSRFRFACLTLAATVMVALPTAAEARKNVADPGSDPLHIACNAAFEICMMACEINDQYNNNGGSEGLPLLSFKDDCEQKCFREFDQCMGMPAPSRLNQSRPVLSFDSDGGTDNSSGGSPGGGDDNGKSGGFTFDPQIFDAPAATFEHGGSDGVLR